MDRIMELETLHIEIDKPFAYITLNRPHVRNAMNQQMVAELTHVFLQLRDDRSVRGIILSGTDGTFCAGGDLKEMQAAYAHDNQDGSTQTEGFDYLLAIVNTAPQAVVAKVEGAAMGGGLGLVCVSDIAVASEDAIFALPEVRLGIVPSLISPYVIRRIGVSSARRLMLTGARFDGIEAANYGVVHESAPPEELDFRLDAILADLRECGPEAIAACKELIFNVAERDINSTTAYRAELLDQLRRSEEGQEGMLAFIQKRKPHWASVGK